jgi:two-component system sporulation sensor kinase B
LEELDRAQHIITDYLTLAKPDPEVIEQINVHEEIRYVANVLKSYANFSNTEIITIMDEWNGPLLIQGDRSKFRQALINIGKNAIESMPYGGLMEFKAVREDAYAAILVKDTGSGMTEAQMKRLGTPYYSTKEKGTGLGTMVSFHIIKNMNGKIKIQSELGKGTCFILTFPLIMGDRKQERAELRRIPRLPG